jgi:hypothetical protein
LTWVFASFEAAYQGPKTKKTKATTFQHQTTDRQAGRACGAQKKEVRVHIFMGRKEGKKKIGSMME